MHSTRVCSDCGAALISVEEIGKVFLRCPSRSCETRRHRRCERQTRNYHENAGGPQEVPPKKTVEELQRFYLDPAGAGFQEALVEARAILEAEGWTSSAYTSAAEWTGLQVRRLRASIRRPSRRRLRVTAGTLLPHPAVESVRAVAS